MNPDVNKIFNKFSKEKTELSTEKVELSLQDAQRIINNAKLALKFRDRMESKIDSARKELSKAVNEVKPVLKEIVVDQKKLLRASSEIDKLKKDMQGAGISTAPLDSRKDQVKDAYNTLSKAYSDLNRIVITATNI